MDEADEPAVRRKIRVGGHERFLQDDQVVCASGGREFEPLLTIPAYTLIGAIARA